MPTVKLTARTVEAARPPRSGRLELFDVDLPGFCIRITPNDRRIACVLLPCRLPIAPCDARHAPPLSLADARQLAREALREAALGHDPASAMREAREALTVAVLVKDYIEAGSGRRSAATNGDYRRTLKAVVQGSSIGQQAARSSTATTRSRKMQHSLRTWRPFKHPARQSWSFRPTLVSAIRELIAKHGK